MVRYIDRRQGLAMGKRIRLDFRDVFRYDQLFQFLTIQIELATTEEGTRTGVFMRYLTPSGQIGDMDRCQSMTIQESGPADVGDTGWYMDRNQGRALIESGLADGG